MRRGGRRVARALAASAALVLSGLAEAAPLTRAEIVERFRAAPVTMCDGLVQVWANCPKAMRREYQSPVAGFCADICRALYKSEKIPPRSFEKPGIVIAIGDVVTTNASVVASLRTRGDGSRYVRVYLPAPGYADKWQICLACARGWALAVKGVEWDDETARTALFDADPETRIRVEADDLAAWRTDGVYTRGRDDEDYLKLKRRILKPGFATREEILTFASRLLLYPPYFDAPFCGRYDQLEFRDAVRLAKDDLMVRIMALKKADELVVWGGGRGARLTAAAAAYSDFLRALARGDVETKELDRLLDVADGKLKETLE